MTTEFKTQVFLGNGETSMAQCYELHRLLEEALEKIAALQQSGSQEDAYEDDEDRDNETALIEQIAGRIHSALTGWRPDKRKVKTLAKNEKDMKKMIRDILRQMEQEDEERPTKPKPTKKGGKR